MNFYYEVKLSFGFGISTHWKVIVFHAMEDFAWNCLTCTFDPPFRPNHERSEYFFLRSLKLSYSVNIIYKTPLDQ